MIRKHDYFKLGLFVIIGTCMLAAVVIVLGAGRYFTTSYTIETYFDESINGLEIGSPVKLRGVKIGRVANIDFVGNHYNNIHENGRRYVYVTCDINQDLFKEFGKDNFKEEIAKEVKRGLRVLPTTLGLTGQLFLNLVYADPDNGKTLKVDWTPEYAYIPSEPSTMSRIEKAITTISKTIGSIKQKDIEGIIKDVKSIVGGIDNFMKTEGGQKRATGFWAFSRRQRKHWPEPMTSLPTLLPNHSFRKQPEPSRASTESSTNQVTTSSVPRKKRGVPSPASRKPPMFSPRTLATRAWTKPCPIWLPHWRTSPAHRTTCRQPSPRYTPSPTASMRLSRVRNPISTASLKTLAKSCRISRNSAETPNDTRPAYSSANRQVRPNRKATKVIS